MKEQYMRFGEYIKKKRLDDPREITLNSLSKILGISLTYLSDIEAGRKKPFDAKGIEKFCEYLNLSTDEKAWLYDLAAKEKSTVPADIEDVLMYEPIGEYARFALRQSNVIAFVRIGIDSVPAPPNRLCELVMRRKNLTVDAFPAEYKAEDLTFTILDVTFKKVKKQILTKNDYISFGLCKPDGTLTQAGLMFSDECPMLQARVFCTRWMVLARAAEVTTPLMIKSLRATLFLSF